MLLRAGDLHSIVARAAAERFRKAGATVPEPQAGFYLYPDFEGWRSRLIRKFDIHTGSKLAKHFLHEYGLSMLAAKEFGEPDRVLKFRAATSMLYGDSDDQREAALVAKDPLTLPWIAESLDRLELILLDTISEPKTVAQEDASMLQ